MTLLFSGCKESDEASVAVKQETHHATRERSDIFTFVPASQEKEEEQSIGLSQTFDEKLLDTSLPPIEERREQAMPVITLEKDGVFIEISIMGETQLFTVTNAEDKTLAELVSMDQLVALYPRVAERVSGGLAGISASLDSQFSGSFKSEQIINSHSGTFLVEPRSAESFWDEDNMIKMDSQAADELWESLPELPLLKGVSFEEAQ